MAIATCWCLTLCTKCPQHCFIWLEKAFVSRIPGECPKRTDEDHLTSRTTKSLKFSGRSKSSPKPCIQLTDLAWTLASHQRTDGTAPEQWSITDCWLGRRSNK